MSTEYLRRHFGIVQQPTGGPEAPAIPRSTAPENLARRTAAVSTSPNITTYVKPEETTEVPDVDLVPSKETGNLGIAWTKGKASGTRTVKQADFLATPYEDPPLRIEPGQ